MSSREVLPAAAVEEEGQLYPRWLPNVYRRIDQLARRSEGWDSYGGNALNADAAETLLDLVLRLNFAIQSEPTVSLTGEGGLVAEWSGPQASLELLVNPEAETSVYYHDAAGNREWEMPVSQCNMLDKWLWQASLSLV